MLFSPRDGSRSSYTGTTLLSDPFTSLHRLSPPICALPVSPIKPVLGANSNAAYQTRRNSNVKGLVPPRAPSEIEEDELVSDSGAYMELPPTTRKLSTLSPEPSAMELDITTPKVPLQHSNLSSRDLSMYETCLSGLVTTARSKLPVRPLDSCAAVSAPGLELTAENESKPVRPNIATTLSDPTLPTLRTTPHAPLINPSSPVPSSHGNSLDQIGVAEPVVVSAGASPTTVETVERTSERSVRIYTAADVPSSADGPYGIGIYTNMTGLCKSVTLYP